MDWININDKQPEKYQEIIICSNQGHVKSALHMGDGKFNTFLQVAYWMPYPKAPDGLNENPVEPIKKKRGRKPKNG